MRSWLLGQRENMTFQLLERQLGMDGGTVVQNMQVRSFEIDNAIALLVCNVSVPDIPLGRNGPIEDRRSGRDLLDRKFNVAPENLQCLLWGCYGESQEAVVFQIVSSDALRHGFSNGEACR